MRELVSNLSCENKLFIGDFDSYTIIRYGITIDQLYHLSKIGLLLFDRLLLPAAFFWQSPNMQSLLLKLEPAIAAGLVLPVIRNYEVTTDIRDYYNRRMEESEKLGKITVFQQPELASEIASPQNAPSVKLLEDINTYAHLDQTSIRATFIKNWKNDLTNPFDINSLRLLLAQANLPIEQLPTIKTTLLDSISNPQFSRASCIELIQNIVPQGLCQNQLIERTSWLYLKSNADAYECGIYYSRNPYNKMVYIDNLQLLEQTLNIFGLSKKIISQLSTKEILHIKGSLEYQRFIKTYRDLVSEIYAEQTQIVSQINKKIRHELKKESSLTVFYSALNKIQSISSVLFLSLIANHFSGSTISTPLLIGSGTTTIIANILKRINSVCNAMESRDFSDFKNYIIKKQFTQRITSNSGVSL